MAKRVRRGMQSALSGIAVAAMFGCPAPEPESPRNARLASVVEQPAPAASESHAKSGRESTTPRARAKMTDRQGNAVGRATLEQVEEGVEVRFEGRNLPPGSRAIHVHTHGACEPAGGFASAGGHWAPHGREHGLENPDGPHMGDMPNLRVDDDGTAEFRYVLPSASLRPGEDASLLAGDGTALVIHAGPDDHVTDPDGAAGERIACGVIEPVPPG